MHTPNFNIQEVINLNKKIIVIFAVVISICAIFISFSPIKKVFTDFFAFGNRITDGFTEKRIKLLYDNYELQICDSAVFIDGENIFGQDRSIWIIFETPENDFEKMISDKWVIKKGATVPVFTDQIKNYKFICTYEYTGKVFTTLSYTQPDKNGNITVLFYGYRPKY